MSIFDVQIKDLERFKGKIAVDLVREMVWADAYACGIKANSINISSDTDTPDGGVDGEVTDVKGNDSRSGIIRTGNTRYQIKSGKLSLNSEIDKILFKDKDHNELRPRIKSCLDNDDTLIIVFTGWDGPDKDKPAKEKFVDRLIKFSQKYKKAKIEVWRQNTIAGMLREFPSLQLKILGIRGGFLFHKDWSKSRKMRRNFYTSDEHKRLIEVIRNELRAKNISSPIRITGESGIGKTRLVLKATSAHDLSPLIIYVEDPKALRNEGFVDRIRRDDNTSFVILIVDKCDYKTHDELWDKLEYKGSMMKLVTISNGNNRKDGFTHYLEVPKLNDKQIGRILAKYKIPKGRIKELVKRCNNLPGMAHSIGENPEQYDAERY